MINLHDIRYVRVGTPNLDAAVDFATSIVGLELVRREGRSAYFRSDKVEVRGDTRDHTLVYFEGDPQDHSIGFDLRNPADFDAVAGALENAGYPAKEGTAAEAAARSARRVLFSRDPSGNKIEIVAQAHNSGTRFFPGRDAGVTDFSHIGLRSTDAKRDEKFWTTIMNARVSDWIGDAPFLRINTYHHSVVLFPAGSGGIQHINHQVEDVDDVMRSYYFLRERNVKIIFGPGRHPISSAIMVYFAGPDGLVYEYSVGVKHIRPEEEATYRPRQFPIDDPKSACMWGSKPDIPELARKPAPPKLQSA